MEDSLWWKTTFDGRWPLMEDTYEGRQSSIENTPSWKMTHNGRQPLMMKMTFYREQPSMEDHLQWKTMFDGRWLLMEEDLHCKITFGGEGENWVPKMEFNTKYQVLFLVWSDQSL